MTSTSKPNNVTGLIVSVTDQGEKDKLAVLVSENGRLFVNFRGVRTQTAKLKQFAAPYVFAEFNLRGSTVTGARLLDSYQGLTTDVYRAAAAAMIAESLSKCSEIGGDLRGELTAALIALKTAEEANVFPYISALWFFLKLLSLEGADTEDFPLRQSEKTLFAAAANSRPAELDSLEASQSEILSGLRAAERIFYSAFGIRLQSVNEAFKLAVPAFKPF